MRKIVLFIGLFLAANAQIELHLFDRGDLYELSIQSDVPLTQAKLHFIDSEGEDIVQTINDSSLYLPKNLNTDMDEWTVSKSIVKVGVEVANEIQYIDVPRIRTLNSFIGFNDGVLFVDGKYSALFDSKREELESSFGLVYEGTYQIKSSQASLLLPVARKALFYVYNFNTNQWEIVEDFLDIEKYAFIVGREQFLLVRLFTYPVDSVWLHEGWNLIGSCELDLSSLQEDNITIVWRYEAGEWRGFSPHQETMEILRRYGYAMDQGSVAGGVWIKSEQNMTLAMQNDCSNTIAVRSGWNLLAHSFSVSPYVFGGALLWSYKNGQWYLFTQTEESDDIAFLHAVKSYQGYWLYSGADTTFEPILVYRNDFERVAGYEYVQREDERALSATKMYGTYLGKVDLEGITLSAWIKFDALEEQELFGLFDGGKYIKVFLNYGEATTTYADGTQESYGNWNINFLAITNTGYAQSSGFIVDDLSNTRIEQDRWYYITLDITEDGNYTLSYNGEVVGRGSTRVVFPQEYGGYEEYVDIGQIKNATLILYPFKGAIDNIRIYRKANAEDR